MDTAPFPDELFFTNNKNIYLIRLDTENNSGVVTNDNLSLFSLPWRARYKYKDGSNNYTGDDYYFHGEYRFRFNSIHTSDLILCKPRLLHHNNNI